MYSFLFDLLRNDKDTYKVIVIHETDTARPVQEHFVRPRSVLLLAITTFIITVLSVALTFMFTPASLLVPGYATADMLEQARQNATEVELLKKNLAVQDDYVRQLKMLFTGMVDTIGQATPAQNENTTRVEYNTIENSLSSDWEDHRTPAIPLEFFSSNKNSGNNAFPVVKDYLSGVRFPVLAPVRGIQTQGFNARTGHYGIDIAVDEGTMVRSVGEGYVIFADWTHEGGYVIAIQHARGYISVFKHNQRLLKQVGDRVQEREPVAMSGNSGEITSGPHLHFELWLNGLAQNPVNFTVDL